MIPRLETARLILRAQTMADWPAYFEFMRSGRAKGVGGPFDEVQAWGMFCHDLALWPLAGQGGLMIDDRATGACLGQVGINTGPLFAEAELGWLVHPDAEGRGVAFEAASALRDWAFRVRGLETLVSYVDRDNLRSRRLAERLGARLDPEAPRRDPEDLVYRHPRP